jgi:competence protein ComEC
VLSISGLHVAIIAAAVQLALQAARVARRAAALATIGATAWYVALIGAPPPALRAATMLAALALSRIFQRPTSPWAPVSAGALVPLLADPLTVLDLGYQLSVVGIVGLVASGRLARRTIDPRLGGWQRGIGRELLTSVVASAVTLPLVAWTFGRVSLVAPLANLAAGPVVAVLQPTLFLALVCAPAPAVARLIADAAHPLLLLLDAVAAVAAAVPHASLTVAPTLAAAVVCGVAAAAFVVACVSHFPARPATCAVGSLAVLAWLPAVPQGSGRAELHMIDVGQGDAIALRTPRGRWVLFDAGRAWSGGDAGRAAVVPYVRRRGGSVAAFVLSHPHLDHVGGAASVLRALRPAQYWDAAFAGGSAAYRASLALADTLGTAWRRVHPGDGFTIDGVEVRFLAPDSSWTASLADPNEASTVASVRYGAVRFLLVGDAERGEEAWLLAHAGELLGADVLKVGHHGSRTSTGAAFLRAVRPRVALVSVGLGNSYGHPNAEVLDALADAEVEVVRSDLVGSAVVRTDGQAITLETNGIEWPLSAARAAGMVPRAVP